MNWKMFTLFRTDDGIDSAKLREGIYREAAGIPQSASASAVIAVCDIPKIASRFDNLPADYVGMMPADHDEDGQSTARPVPQDTNMDPSPPELAESTSTQPSGSEVAPKPVLVDERETTHEQWFAKLSVYNVIQSPLKG